MKQNDINILMIAFKYVSISQLLTVSTFIHCSLINCTDGEGPWADVYGEMKGRGVQRRLQKMMISPTIDGFDGGFLDVHFQQ